jgi:hypothetical protein
MLGIIWQYRFDCITKLILAICAIFCWRRDAGRRFPSVVFCDLLVLPMLGVESLSTSRRSACFCQRFVYWHPSSHLGQYGILSRRRFSIFMSCVSPSLLFVEFSVLRRRRDARLWFPIFVSCYPGASLGLIWCSESASVCQRRVYFHPSSHLGKIWEFVLASWRLASRRSASVLHLRVVCRPDSCVGARTKCDVRSSHITAHVLSSHTRNNSKQRSRTVAKCLIHSSWHWFGQCVRMLRPGHHVSTSHLLLGLWLVQFVPKYKYPLGARHFSWFSLVFWVGIATMAVTIG